MAKKPAPKPTPKPTPKPPVLRRPAINPIDAVRNPNFGAAMAQQNYFNNLSRLVAERNARGPEYGLMPIGNPEDARRMEAAMAERNAALTSGTAQPINDPEFIDSRQPGSNYTMNMINYVDPATGQMVARTAGIVPRAGSRFVPVDRFGQTQNKPIPTSGTAYNQIPPMSTGGTALPPEFFNLAPAYDVSKLPSDYQARRDGPTLMPIGQFSPEQIQNLSSDRRQALEQRMGVQQNPSLSQMQDYNRMLQQGIQNSNTMNQGAMANFANMQPGMQAPQQPRPAVPNPAMPAAGMGMQQPRQVPAQRKLSTFNNTPARFG